MKKSLKPSTWIVAAILITAMIIVIQYRPTQYLTLDYLKSQKDALEAYYSNHPISTVAIYFVVYVVTTALSIPGATILTLAGGAVFKFGLGLLIVSFASTLGAACAFLVSRYLLRDFVQTKYRDRLAKINDEIRNEGAFYLFALRLAPVVPFFVINLVMGLTPIKTWTFFWVSQLGMLLGTVVYVNAGTQLARISSLREILSPGVFLSFAALGILPVVAKKLLSALRKRKSVRKYAAPKRTDYNLVVIGAGSGGLVSAYIAAAVKAKVALIERNHMGGDCLNTGCVPSKALIRSAKILSYAKRAREFGFRHATVDFDFAEVMDRVQRVIGKIALHDSVERYTGLGVECIAGEAKILSPYCVEINGNRKLTTRNIIVATGATPVVPQIKGMDFVKALTSDTVWGLRVLPKRMLVLGGGPIGCELAQCFQRLGSQVTLVEMSDRILGREDPDVSLLIAEQLKREGITILTGSKAKEILFKDGQKIATCECQSGETQLPFDEVLVALGRKATTQGFGLEELGVQISKRGTIEVDEHLRTNYPNLYAVGDVGGPYQFTHTAAHMAWYATVNALFSPIKSFKVDYRVIPACTFTDPEVARVGLNELEAEAKGIPYSVSMYSIDDLDRAIADEEDHGFVKVLTLPGRDKILGATVVGAHAGDYIVEFVTAMKHSLGLKKILGTIHIYPTLGEANKYAAGIWAKANQPAGLLKWVQTYHGWRR